MHKVKVLYIDDEKINLLSFKSSFRREYDIYTASSAKEGIKILKEHSIEVILCDQRMPNMTGVEFFESIKTIHTNPIRVLITAYTDTEAIIDAINKAEVFKYISKPWVVDELKQTIQTAYQFYSLQEQNNRLRVKYQSIFNNTVEPIFLLDKQGKIIDFNNSAIEFLGRKKEALLNKMFVDFIAQKTNFDKLQDKLNYIDNVNNIELDIDTNIGRRACILSINRIQDKYETTTSYQVLLKDITEHELLNRLLLQNSIETQENERKRIYSDLHDSVGQSLMALSLNLQSLQANNVNEIVNKCYKLIDYTSNEIKRICNNVTPQTIKDNGLKAAIDDLINTYDLSNISLNFSFSGDVNDINTNIAINTYRTIQEFVNNAIKHGEATKITIQINENDKEIQVILKDNGKGFDVNNISFKKNHGIYNIKSRISSLKGNFDIKSDLNKGTQFLIDIPKKIRAV